MDIINGRTQYSDYHRIILDNISGGVQIAQILYDDQGQPSDYLFVDVNSVFAEIIGLAKEEIVGQRVTDLFPDAEPEWFIKYGEIVKKGQPETFERLIVSTGSWYSILAVPLGEQDRLAIVTADVSERRDMEEKLRICKEYQAFQRKLSNALSQISDAEGIMRTAAHVVGEYLGVDHALYNEITNNGETIHIEDSYVPWGARKITGDFPVSSFGAAMKVLSRGEPLILEDHAKDPLTRTASTSLDVDASMTVPLIKEGRWVANFGVLQNSPRQWTNNELAILKDAAERTWAAVERARAEAEVRNIRDNLEAEVKERTREIAVERQRLFDVLETLPSALCLMSPDHRVQFSNRAYRKIYGEPDGDLCHDHIHGLDGPCQGCESFRPLETGQMHRWIFSTPEGSMIEIHDFPFIDVDGKSMVLEMSVDITDRKKLERELARLDRLNLIGQMAAGIGHEIRNPMTAVRGFLQMLGDKPEYANDLAFFELMIEELDRANSIISEFLSLARDKMVDLQPGSLTRVVKSLYPMIKSDANLREIDVKLHLNNAPQVLIDKNEIRQMILNMSQNAMEAMSPHGTLTIGTRPESDEVVIYIKDEGSGINPEIIDKLGTPFMTTKENGTGMGLAICYSIAARHNARIECATGLEGTTFYVRFPTTGKLASDQVE